MTVQADLIRSKRHAFALPGGFHDKLIRTLGVILPGAVGAVVAVMVIAPLFPRGEVSFLLDRNKVAVTQERLRVDHAMYRGEDNNGRPFSLTAGSAVQHSATIPVVKMDDLVARILLADGPAELTAPDGNYNFDKNQIEVRGPVDFRASDGYRLATSGVMIDLDDQHVTGAGGVEGTLTAGTFKADRLFADLDERTVTLDGHARLRMDGGKLTIPR
jgi:lipopolysaccharide export system protein LptC